MDKVSDNLYVGDVNDADNPKKLSKQSVDYILNVSGTSTEAQTAPSYETVTEKTYVHMPLADDGSNTDFFIKEVINTGKHLMDEAAANGSNLLVHCSVGTSRSIAIAAALMSLENERVVPENVNRIKNVRSSANPHPELQSQVARLTREVFDH